MDIKKILSEVPDYKGFFTMAELDESTFRLAREFPELVTVTELGRSRGGHPIYCLKIGHYEKNALVYGSPHPSEPIGGAMLEFLTRKLCEDKDFRDELGFTWYVIKSVDPDGTGLNEGWFKGPFNFFNYTCDFFRPVNSDQSEIGLPIEFEGETFGRMIPETECVLKVIDEAKPKFLFSLHNAGFGGVYWLMSHDLKGAYPDLWEEVESRGLPLAMGDDDGAFIGLFDKAVHKQWTVFQAADFYHEKYGMDRREILCDGGQVSDYLRRLVPGAFTLICEAPYYCNAATGDTSPSDKTLREVLLKQADTLEPIAAFITERFDRMAHLISPENRLGLAVRQAAKRGRSPGANRDAIMNDPAFEAHPTVAEAFQMGPINHFYRTLDLGMLARAARTEADSGRHSPEDVEMLRKIDAEAMAEAKRNCDILESEIEYKVVPIRDLVSIELASALYCIRELNK